MEFILPLAMLAVGVAAGALVGLLSARGTQTGKVEELRTQHEQQLEAVRAELDKMHKDTLATLRRDHQKAREKLDKDSRTRKQDMQTQEKRLQKLEQDLEKRTQQINNLERDLRRREDKLTQDERRLEDALVTEQKKLEEVGKLTAEEAKAELLSRIQRDVEEEAQRLVASIEKKAREEGDAKAREIVTFAVQKVAVGEVLDNTISVVALPSDDIKGRIIGREGRNIRTFEMLAGVDVIVDDTPEAVIVSAFDPMRREIARLALERLVGDGRIHPTRIEEAVAKAKGEVKEIIQKAGDQALFETGVTGLAPELVRLVGQMRYRMAEGQNLLSHAIEVSLIAKNMAAELGLDVNLAARGGLLHDIGKAVEFDAQTPHDKLGAELARKHRENKQVVNIIESHEGNAPFQCGEAVLVHVANVISKNRPGARKESLDAFMTRMTRMEEMAREGKGVKDCFAIQAGKEIRVVVFPDQVDDRGAIKLARDLSHRLEKELDYTGQIKVSVLRESRVTETAR